MAVFASHRWRWRGGWRYGLAHTVDPCRWPAVHQVMHTSGNAGLFCS